jgi:hypothetical protein
MPYWTQPTVVRVWIPPEGPQSIAAVLLLITFPLINMPDTLSNLVLSGKLLSSTIPSHLCERALGMLQGDMRAADVAKAIYCNVRTVRRLRQCYRETARTADHHRSGRPHVTTPAQYRYIQTSHLRDRYRMENNNCLRNTRNAQSLHQCSDGLQ